MALVFAGGYELALDVDDFQPVPGGLHRCSHCLQYSDKHLTETPSTVCTTDGHGLPYSTGQLHQPRHMMALSVTVSSRSEGWPHHGRTFSIYLSPLTFLLTLPRGVLSNYRCCPSRPCVVFLACVHLALFLVLSLSPGNSLVSSWCDHSMLASLL